MITTTLVSLYATSAQPEAATSADNPTTTRNDTLGQVIDEIRVYGRRETEDFERPQKTPIQKLRDKLEKSPVNRGMQVKEHIASDGRRVAQIDIDGKRFCAESRAGQIDFSGAHKEGQAMRLITGNTCN